MSQAKKAVQALISADESPCLIGPSGIGKTEVVAQIARDMGYELVPVYLITKDPVELSGFPRINPEGFVEWVPVKIFLAGNKPKMFFFDEITHATSMVQSIAYQIFQERRCGDHLLPPNCAVLGAHNRVVDRGVHNRVPMPLRRRWWELQIEPDIEAWSTWAVGANIEPLVIAFLRFRSDLLYADSVNDEPAPDPRAWAKISRVLQHSHGNLDSDTRHTLYCGKVGEAAAVEFSAFERLYRSLPNIDSILLNPEKAPVSEDPATLFAVSAALARRISDDNIDRAITYLNRLPVEFNVYSIRDAHRRDASIASTPDFTKWAIAHQEVIF